MRVQVVVRELDRKKPDFSLPFDVESVPRIGEYISIWRPDSETHTEDVVVRRVWWHLTSPERQDSNSAGEPRPGKVREVLVECDVAVGPYARDQWRVWAKAAASRGSPVEEFDVERFSVSEEFLKPK